MSDVIGEGQCTFERVENYNGQPCAGIAVSIKFSGTRPEDGTIATFEVKGKILRSLEAKVDLKVDLTGKITMEDVKMQVSGLVSISHKTTLAK